MQVFHVHGIECEVLNGNLGQKECMEAVEGSHKQPNIKGLLVFSVGKVELNLRGRHGHMFFMPFSLVILIIY